MASCSIFLSNVAYLDIVIVDNPQVLTVIWVTFSLSSFLMLLITFLIQNGALRQSADSLSPARPSSHSSLVQDPSLPPPSRPFLPDLLSMGLALMRTAEIMNAITITLEEIILCLFCVSNLKSIHPIKPIYLMSNIEVRLEDTPGCPPPCRLVVMRRLCPCLWLGPAAPLHGLHCVRSQLSPARSCHPLPLTKAAPTLTLT